MASSQGRPSAKRPHDPGGAIHQDVNHDVFRKDDRPLPLLFGENPWYLPVYPKGILSYIILLIPVLTPSIIPRYIPWISHV